jgi:PKD repeat protein
MNSLNYFKIFLVTLISFFSFQSITAQCVAGFTFVDNGGGNYSFTNTSTGTANDFIWDFGDGNSATTFNASNTYLYNGQMVATLIILDSINPGCIDVFTDTFTVTSAANTVSCMAAFNVVNNGNGSYSFSNASSSNAATFSWNFGDGNTSTLMNPTHTYAANGTYVVSLTISDSTSTCIHTGTMTFQVTTVTNPVACQAGFVIIPDTMNAIVFNTSTGSGLTYFWDFGDGNTSTQQFPTHTYTTNGPFNLCLIVNDNVSCTSTFCDSISTYIPIFVKQSGFTITVQAPILSGIELANQQHNISLFPNPTKGNFTVDLGTSMEMVKATVSNTLGQVVVSQAYQSTNKIDLNIDAEPGVYFLQLETSNAVISTLKIVKE